MKKYELTDQKKIVERRTLCRIRALRDFAGAKAGDLGGFVESENNLSHRDDAWVRDNAMVYGNAMVRDNATVRNDALVRGNATVCGNATLRDNATVYGNATVHGNATVRNNATVCDNAMVYGNATVRGNAMVRNDAMVRDNATVRNNATVRGNILVFENATVGGNVTVCGNARIGRDAKINNYRQYLTVFPIGNRNDATTFFRTRNGGIGVNSDCFSGTIDEFAAKVEKTHGDNKFGREYKAAIELAKVHILGKDDALDKL